MRVFLAIVLLAFPALSALAAEMNLTVEIPRLQVAEYHRPYVAVWIEGEQHEVAAQLALWYDQANRKEDGAKWLKDLRQWWRRGGRELALPVDGVTGATRPAGQQQLRLQSGQPPLGELKAGSYTLVVEAAREVGGREVLKLPFTWPVSAPLHVEAQGQHELGRIALDINP
ncbi:MAG TPA: DUF2271 domain-containing protein [Rhodanobacteraceae bacterium]|nr:DUF2271 domain-containing protein [Rhodanobacteraceae bacterium]